jgi:2'-5' RNA ligase
MEKIEAALAFSKSILRPPVNNQSTELISNHEELYEYLLLLSPYGFVREKIIKEKKYFSKDYGNNDAKGSLPHITLAKFILSSFSQEEIIAVLENVAKNSNPIKVILENYNWFPRRTIFIDVKYKADIKQLVRKITKAVKRHIKADNEHSPVFILNPHLTLCKGMDETQYCKKFSSIF